MFLIPNLEAASQLCLPLASCQFLQSILSALALGKLLAAMATGRGYSRVCIHRVPLGLPDVTIMTVEQPEVESRRGYISETC